MSVNRTQFAYQLLAALGVRPTYDNVAAIAAWYTLENTQKKENKKKRSKMKKNKIK
jgi:hypothetical protein